MNQKGWIGIHFYFKWLFMHLLWHCSSIRFVLSLQTCTLEAIMWTSYLVLWLSQLWLCGNTYKSMNWFEMFAYLVHSCGSATSQPAAEKCFIYSVWFGKFKPGRERTNGGILNISALHFCRFLKMQIPVNMVIQSRIFCNLFASKKWLIIR